MKLTLKGSLDTNIILRWVLGDIPEQTAKTDLLINSGKPLRVSLLVIAEVVYILEATGFSRLQIQATIERLAGQQNLYLNRYVVVPAVRLYAKNNSISFVDACLVYDSSESGAVPLYTFDKKLANKSPQTIKLL